MTQESWGYPCLWEDVGTYAWFETEKECVESAKKHKSLSYYTHMILDCSTGKKLVKDIYYIKTGKLYKRLPVDN